VITKTNHIKTNSLFGNLHRPQHVLIVLIDQDGNFLLGHKPNFYPSGIYRFVGGGVKKDEEPDTAVEREFEEELGLKPCQQKLKFLAQVNTIANYNNQEYTNQTFLYLYQLDGEEAFKAGDDIEDLINFTPLELQELIYDYYKLDDDNWFIVNGEPIHCWSDYGKMYGYIHQVALDLVS